MGCIKEPSGINFVVDPTPLTATDRKKISDIIANYKATGKKPRSQKIIRKARLQKNGGKKLMA